MFEFGWLHLNLLDCMFLLYALLGFYPHQCLWWLFVVVCVWAPASFLWLCVFVVLVPCFSAWVDTHI